MRKCEMSWKIRVLAVQGLEASVALEALQITKDWTTFVSCAEKDIRDDDFSKNDRAKDHYRKRLDTVLEIQTVLKQYRT
jgi:hypothetical protein